MIRKIETADQTDKERLTDENFEELDMEVLKLKHAVWGLVRRIREITGEVGQFPEEQSELPVVPTLKDLEERVKKLEAGK